MGRLAPMNLDPTPGLTLSCAAGAHHVCSQPQACPCACHGRHPAPEPVQDTEPVCECTCHEGEGDR